MRKYKGKRICIICEGHEELEYIETLKRKGVFSSKYDFITVNAKSINNIIKRYQEKYQSDSYELVLIFCDTDKGPSEKYKEIKKSINDFHGDNVANEIIIFGNPCTMQIIISHFTVIKLRSQSKTVNSRYINKYVGIDNYKATDMQRKELFGKIKRSNYITMKENIAKLSTNDNDLSSTNFLKFVENFESDDDSWIDEIKNKPSHNIENISIIVDIMYNNTNAYHVCVAILSKLLSFEKKTEVERIISIIEKKFSKIPNTDYLSIWLQRITIVNNPKREYDSKICKKVYDSSYRLWNSDWLNFDIDEDIINKEELIKLEKVVPSKDLEIFDRYIY